MQLPSAALSVNDKPEHLKYMCTLSMLLSPETLEMKKMRAYTLGLYILHSP